MLRFITFLLGKQYEVCKSCETLREQLSYERDEKKRLTDTLLNIINPKVIEQPVVELSPIQQTAGLWTRRRQALEEKDRLESQVLKSSKNLGKPDNLKDVTKEYKDINELEAELGIETVSLKG